MLAITTGSHEEAFVLQLTAFIILLTITTGSHEEAFALANFFSLIYLWLS
jgi:hypothetical protein